MRKDVAIIGGGIVGLSVARALAPHAQVVVIEREAHAGYHSTGRSAAIFVQPYEGPAVRALSRLSRTALETELSAQAGRPLLRDRGVLVIASPGRMADLETRREGLVTMDGEVQAIGAAAALEMCPALRREAVGGALHDPTASDIDVDGLLQTYSKAARSHGAELLFGAPVEALERTVQGWRIRLADGREVLTEVLVNAAGAWAGALAAMVQAQAIPLEPRLRTAMTIEAPGGVEVSAWPMVTTVDDDVYFKPDAGRLLVSLAEERPVEPFDAWPRDEDVAEAIERLQTIADIEVSRAPRSWAGLRTFTPDRAPLLGFDGQLPGYCWAAGLGGFGVQTSPAVGDLVAATVLGRRDDLGLGARVLAALDPARFTRAIP